MDDKQIIENLKSLQNKVYELDNKIKTSPYENNLKNNSSNTNQNDDNTYIHYYIYIAPILVYAILLYLLKPDFIKENKQIDQYLTSRVLSYPLLIMFTLIFTFCTDIFLFISTIIYKKYFS